MSNAHAKWLTTGCAVSAALHMCALGALAVWSVDRLATQSQMGASPGMVVFQASFSEPQPIPVPAVEITIAPQPVTISPNHATAASRRFVDISSTQVPLEDFLTREVLDRLLESPSEEFAATSIDERSNSPPEITPAPPAREHQLPRQPTTERHPPIKLSADVHKSQPTPQADAGLRTGPSFAGNRPPSYPAAARRNGWHGEVMLRLHISAAGAVTLVEVESSSGYEILDAEAVATVRTWRGTPATLNGEPVASVERLPVIFRLP